MHTWGTRTPPALPRVAADHTRDPPDPTEGPHLWDAIKSPGADPAPRTPRAGAMPGLLEHAYASLEHPAPWGAPVPGPSPGRRCSSQHSSRGSELWGARTLAPAQARPGWAQLSLLPFDLLPGQGAAWVGRSLHEPRTPKAALNTRGDKQGSRVPKTVLGIASHLQGRNSTDSETTLRAGPPTPPTPGRTGVRGCRGPRPRQPRHPSAAPTPPRHPSASKSQKSNWDASTRPGRVPPRPPRV